MEKRQALQHMNLRRRITPLLFSLILGINSLWALPASADLVDDLDEIFDLSVETGETNTDASQGDIIESQCAELDESLAGALGCDTSDEIVDFTELEGELEAPDEAGYAPQLTENKSAREFIQTIVNYALSFLGLIAVVIVVYGGVMYVLSRGDEDMASTGKKAISYAAIGILIILGSFAMVNTLLRAGGGDGSGDGSGGEVDGTTITETGASFDTEFVLEEIEEISAEYLDSYQTLLTVSQEVAYMQSVEMPIIIDVEETDWTINGLLEHVLEWAQNTDSDYADQYTLIDEDDVEDYIDMLREGIQDIQQEVDSLSGTYEAAQALYNYLRSGTQTSYLDRFFARLIPKASAASVEEIIQELDRGVTTTDACNTRDYDESTELYTYALGYTVYDMDIREIDDKVCSYIVAIQTAAEGDYIEEVGALLERFREMKDLFDTEGQGFDSGSKLTEVLDAFNAADELLDSSLETVNAKTAQEIVTAMNDLHNLVENLEFVKVRLKASATSGNDPLIVRFNVLGTEDPSGKTVEDDQIEWDLNGDGNFESSGTLNTAAVTSENTEGDAVSATYNEPGTYRIRVRVRSQDENIAAGVSMVTVEVEPSKSMIVLTAQAGTEAASVIADFRSFPAIDQRTYKVTMSEAEGGITFDASETTDGDGNTGAEGGIVYYEWEFGDSETASGSYGQEGGSTVTHVYGEAGSYNLSLTVTDDTGVKDRKYFTLFVASPAARFSMSPSSGTVGTIFEFDASGSTTDIGKIVSTSWTLTKEGTAVPLEENNREVIAVALEEPGVYTMQLIVSDGSGKTDTASLSFLVESTAPVASYEYTVPSQTQPATLFFDAGESYDPDEGDTLTFEWEFEGTEGEDYTILSAENENKELTVQFLKKGDYGVSLTVYDQHSAELKKSDTAVGTITIDSTLDIGMEIQGETARHLDANGQAEVEFTAISATATAFEIDYGDGSSDYTDTITRGETILTHVYETAGVFEVVLTALNDEDDENSIKQRVYIGAGDAPIAVIAIGAEEDIGTGSSLKGSIKTKFSFDATESINVDGSTDNLDYSWNFGDGVTSSQSTVTHSFSEQRTFTVTLTVRDEDDSTVMDQTSVNILIEGMDPVIRGITVTPEGDKLETPLKVDISVDAFDEDGEITFIKAWYYDLNDTAEALGEIIAQSTEFQMTIDTKGKTGETLEYGFAVEVTDDDSNEVSSSDFLDSASIPTLEVTNGPNETPVAGISVDRTSVYVGEPVSFSSTSYDTDGEIVNYWWDIEGDGFWNNEPTEEASFEYEFSQVHPEGIEVQLKVEDDAGATDPSETLTIFVDALSAPPEAAFLTEITGTTVSFQNNSIIDFENDAKLEGQYWDFDLSVDSNGNGSPDDDTDSFEENPIYTYPALGTYEARLTIVDSTGQADTVTRTVNVSESTAPEAKFSTIVNDKMVDFKNETSFDTAQGAEFLSASWDFNLTADTNGDTDPENDTDATTKNPSFEYADYGSYQVKLIVEDSFGKTDSTVQTVVVSSPLDSVQALLTSTPQPNSLNQVVLEKDGDEVSFYYGAEGGSEDLEFVLDKNIFYDTDNDGVRDNDRDFVDDSAGSWKTPFYKSYGQVVVKLTVNDKATGEKDISTLQVVFEGSLGGANLFNATPSEMMVLIVSALITALAAISFIFKAQLTKITKH